MSLNPKRVIGKESHSELIVRGMRGMNDAISVKRSGILSKADLIAVAESGNFIYDPEYQAFADLDGTEAARYLHSRGFDVITYFDTGHNGWAITTCGIKLSTNGFICRSRDGHVNAQRMIQRRKLF